MVATELSFSMTKSTLLLFALSLHTSWSETLNRHRRGDAPYPPMLVEADDRCGHQMCPPDYHHLRESNVIMEDGTHVRGLLCKYYLKVYGRGSGYPWQVGDWPFDWNPALQRCNIGEPKELGCELWGYMAYPRCRWGFKPYSCCLCSVECPGKEVVFEENMADGLICLLPCRAG